jgi:hypothetical protein
MFNHGTSVVFVLLEEAGGHALFVCSLPHFSQTTLLVRHAAGNAGPFFRRETFLAKGGASRAAGPRLHLELA